MEPVKSVAHKKRAWIYCRVATETPDAFELQMQQERLNAYAEKQQFEVVDTIAEYAKGVSLMRNGIAKISRAAEQGLMDVLLVSSINRLGRTPQEVYEYILWLRSHSVCVVSMSDLL